MLWLLGLSPRSVSIFYIVCGWLVSLEGSPTTNYSSICFHIQLGLFLTRFTLVFPARCRWKIGNGMRNWGLMLHMLLLVASGVMQSWRILVLIATNMLYLASVFVLIFSIVMCIRLIERTVSYVYYYTIHSSIEKSHLPLKRPFKLSVGVIDHYYSYF